MAENPDYRDLFAALNVAGVRYLLVGGQAFSFHAVPRYTKDLDVWIDRSLENARRTVQALVSFGANVADLRAEDLTEPGIFFQIGVAPVRVDILTTLAAVDFEEAWQARVPTSYGDQPISVISREHLRKNKLAVGRLIDLADAEKLEKFSPK